MGVERTWSVSTGLAAVLLATTFGVAQGADLGGNCCADLEERIAELEATTARKGNRKVSLEVSGWINKSILWWDDSVRSDAYTGIDNDAAQSRYRFTGTAVITPDVRAGFVYEFGTLGSLTSFVNQSNGGDDLPGFRHSLRQANVWLESKRLGRFTIGYASQATDGIAEIDLSRTEAVSGSGVNAWMSNFASNFKVGGIGPFYYFPMIEHFGGNFDGGRDQLVRWDSPTLMGFTLSGSISGGREYYTSPPGTIPPTGPSYVEWDVALRYAGEFNGWRFASGIGYHHGVIRDSDALPATIGGSPGFGLPGGGTVSFNWDVPVDTIVGSSALLHMPSGFFLTTASGQVTFGDTAFDGDKYTYLYAKTGFLVSLTQMGQTSLYGEYYQMKYERGAPTGYDYLGVDFTSRMWGVGIVQHIDAAAMEVYLAYRYYDSPDITFPVVGAAPLKVEFGDLQLIQAGARIKF